MEKLGYIITSAKIKTAIDFVEVTSDETCYSSSKPTMVVGLDLAKKIIPDFSIIKKRLGNNKFWTFSKTEKRTDFDNDVKEFYRYVLEESANNIKYRYIDLTRLPRKRITGLLNLINSQKEKCIYIYKDMIYLYQEGYVLGISMKMLRYIGIDTNKHMKLFTDNKHIKIYYSDNKLSQYVRQIIKHKRYLTPYFLSLMD